MHEMKEVLEGDIRPEVHQLSENMLNDALIVISNLIARATTKWTLEETKMFLCSVSQIKKRDKDNWVMLPKRDILEKLNINPDNGTWLRQTFKKMMQKSYIELGNNDEWDDGFLITRVRSDKKNIYVRFEDTYIPLLDQLSTHFTEFYIDYIKDFSRLSSYNLYVYLCSWQDSSYREQRKKIAKSELAKVFNLKEGEYWRNYGKETAKFDWKMFETKVLNPAIKEINDFKSCDMHILSCDKVKNGKFVLGYDIHYAFVDEDGFYK